MTSMLAHKDVFVFAQPRNDFGLTVSLEAYLHVSRCELALRVFGGKNQLFSVEIPDGIDRHRDGIISVGIDDRGLTAEPFPYIDTLTIETDADFITFDVSVRGANGVCTDIDHSAFESLAVE